MSMNLNNINLSGKLFDANWLSQWSKGDKVLLELISQEKNGEGIILLRGQSVRVLLDTQVQPGERFWAVVRSVSPEQLILVKLDQVMADAAKQTNTQVTVEPTLAKNELNSEISVLLKQRGFLINDGSISKLIDILPKNKNEWPIWIARLQSELTKRQPIEWPEIPDWSDMKAEGGGKLLSLLRGLGIDYEARLLHLLNQVSGSKNLVPGQDMNQSAETQEPTETKGYKQTIYSDEEMRLQSLKQMVSQEPEMMTHKQIMGLKLEEEIQILKQTLKGQVMTELATNSNLDRSVKGVLTDLLAFLTSQQLWLLCGTGESAYFLLSLPFTQQNEIAEAKIAVEARRKGAKIDEQHCRIAVLTDTVNLGAIGIDAWFGGDTLRMKLLSDQPEEMGELLAEVLAPTKDHLARVGYIVAGIEVEKLEMNSEFVRFVQGNRRSGVDLMG